MQLITFCSLTGPDDRRVLGPKQTAMSENTECSSVAVLRSTEPFVLVFDSPPIIAPSILPPRRILLKTTTPHDSTNGCQLVLVCWKKQFESVKLLWYNPDIVLDLKAIKKLIWFRIDEEFKKLNAAESTSGINHVSRFTRVYAIRTIIMTNE